MTPHEQRLAFIATHILPNEAQLRRWLSLTGLSSTDCDDLVQEIYYRLLRYSKIEDIRDPMAYVSQIARNILRERYRRENVVSIATMHNLDDLGLEDQAPSPERFASARHELERVLRLIDALPARCKAIFELRRIHGLSQAETAQKLELSENIVEKETVRGLGLILRRIADEGAVSPSGSNDPPPATTGTRHVRH